MSELPDSEILRTKDELLRDLKDLNFKDSKASFIVFARKTKFLSYDGIVEEVQKIKSLFCASHIWQKAELEVESVENIGPGGTANSNDNNSKIALEEGFFRLTLSIEFGECIEDEWLAVSIVFELSRRLPELWIYAKDDDGDFLLIEAAEILDDKIDYHNSSYRLWIHNGSVFFIPFTNSVDLSRGLNEVEAVNQFESAVEDGEINSIIQKRIAFFPEALKASWHWTVVRIPRKLAYKLHNQPQSVTNAIQNLSNIHMSNASMIHTLRRINDEIERDPVKISVKMTKLLYAQLTYFNQKFLEAAALFPKQSVDDKQIVNGLKVSYGFWLAEPHLSCFGENILSDEEISKLPLIEDSEKFLDLDFTSFDSLMKSKSGTQYRETDESDKKKPLSNEKVELVAKDTFEEIVTGIERFLNNENAGPEGVAWVHRSTGSESENENDQSDSEYESLENTPRTEAKKENDELNVNFDENEFIELLSGAQQEQDTDEEKQLENTMSEMDAQLAEYLTDRKDVLLSNSDSEFTRQNLAENLAEILKQDPEFAYTGIGAALLGDSSKNMAMPLPENEDSKTN